MQFSSVPSCCTGVLMNALGSLEYTAGNDLLSVLKTTIPDLLKSRKVYDDNLLDYSLIHAITTDSQSRNKPNLINNLRKLSFKEVYTSSKHDGARHKETGPLTMWCTTPPEFMEARLAYIKEIEESMKPKPVVLSEEEKARRLTFPEVRFYKIMGYNDTLKKIKNNIFQDRSVRSEDIVPASMVARGEICEAILNLTGGLPLDTTPEWRNYVNGNMTFGQLKAICNRYRNGEI